MVRKHLKEEQEKEEQEKAVEAILQKANADAERDRIIQRALAIAKAAAAAQQSASEADHERIVQWAVTAAMAEQSATETETSSDDTESVQSVESDNHSTILSGFFTLTSRWTAKLARGLGFRRS